MGRRGKVEGMVGLMKLNVVVVHSMIMWMMKVWMRV